MFKKTSAAAVIWAMLAFGGGTAAASGADPTPITTQAAYESWLAWYHARPSAPADANGPRYRQLLAEPDGGRYFLRGLDDASRQIRELSKRGLISAPIDDHDIDFELWKRLGSRDERVRRQSEEILNARADRLFPDPAVDVDLALNGCGPDGYVYSTSTLQEYPRLETSFNWTIPFGGLLRVALASRPLDGSQPSYCWEDGLDPDILDLVVAIRNLEYCPGCAPCEPWQDEIQHLKRMLAQAESRQASQRSAQRLLTMLDQTIPSSPIDDITVEEVKQALRSMSALRWLRQTRPAARPAANRFGTGRTIGCGSTSSGRSMHGKPRRFAPSGRIARHSISDRPAGNQVRPSIRSPPKRKMTTAAARPTSSAALRSCPRPAYFRQPGSTARRTDLAPWTQARTSCC